VQKTTPWRAADPPAHRDRAAAEQFTAQQNAIAQNVDTKSLIDARVYEGAFNWAPLRIVGGRALVSR